MKTNLPSWLRPKSPKVAKPRSKPRHFEEAIQVQCVRWLRYKYPKAILFAIPNGGKRNLREAVRLKSSGVLKGVPDLCLAKAASGYHGLYIEMKHGNNKPTDEQDKVIKALKSEGYAVAVCYSLEEFMEVVNAYMDGNAIDCKGIFQ